MVEIVKSIFSEEDEGIRIDRWFQRHHKQYSFAQISKMTRTGQIRVDGKRVKGSAKVIMGQEIRFPNLILYDDRETVIKGYDKKSYKVLADELISEIIYMNTHAIVLNKPAGMAVQGGIGIQNSIDQLSAEMIFDAKQKPKLVHRIDKDTSGILVLARSDKAAQELSEIFRNREIDKKYIAIVQGKPSKNSGVIDIPLEKQYQGAGFENMAPSDNGKDAVTRYKILVTNGEISMLELKPITGRKHQIRAHLAAINCPIIGDRKYNQQYNQYKRTVGCNLLLHAYEMQLDLFGEKLCLQAPVPQHFYEALDFFELQNCFLK